MARVCKWASTLHLSQQQTPQASQAGCIHTSKTKQMFSEGWSNICFLPSCPSAPSSDSNGKAWWHQQTLHKFRPRCTSVSRRLFPAATILVPRLLGSPTAPITARRPVCEVPGCRHRPWNSAVGEEPSSPSLLFSRNGPSGNPARSTRIRRHERL